MDQFIQFRQMMAEQKFFELQKLIEVQLNHQNESRYELLSMYVEVLKAQEKHLPPLIVVELAEHLLNIGEHHKAIELVIVLDQLHTKKLFNRISKIVIQANLQLGQMGKLYTLISNHLLHQFETQNPVIPLWHSEISSKYFSNDFNLQLKELSLALLTQDLAKCEKLLKTLITISIEKSSPKGINLKLSLIAEVLKSTSNKAQLEIYQNFCLLSSKEELEKTDYKKIVEMILYFDDFKFQVLILNLIHSFSLSKEASEYAEAIKANTEYDFVYFDKYFPQLKNYFFKFSKKIEKKSEDSYQQPDLKLSKKFSVEVISPRDEINEVDEDESQYFNILKYQTFTTNQLCDLAVSFLQSEMPKVSLKASQMVIDQSEDDKIFLKGCYLKLTSLLQLKDYRAALDTCLEALTKARTNDDILSFMYGQAEVYIRLKENKHAKVILSQIIKIDSQYRSAKERLEKLNEI